MNTPTNTIPVQSGVQPTRIAVLLSGSGRTLVNLCERIDAGELDAQIALVIASRPCAGVERARERGIPVVIEPGRIPRARLGALLEEAGATWALCAGYLQLVEIPAGFEGKVVNIHPSLLPAHGGTGMYAHRVHEAVLASGDRESGCTVHLCDDQYDRGPIVLQKRCKVLPGDTAQTLSARVFELELEAYPEAMRLLLARDDRTSAPAR